MRLVSLSLMTFSLCSCANGPVIKVCLSSPSSNEFRCYDPALKVNFVKKFADTENYICISPEDEQTLLDFCENKKQ